MGRVCARVVGWESFGAWFYVRRVTTVHAVSVDVEEVR